MIRLISSLSALALTSLFIGLQGCNMFSNKASSFQKKVIEIDDIKLTLNPIKSSVYQSITNTSEGQKILDLCNESKGYKQNSWDILNECSWALEKYKLSTSSDKVSRDEEILYLQLKNEKIEFVHEPSSKIFYQFYQFLPQSNHFIVRKFNDTMCPEFLLINGNDGKKTSINGVPVFNEKQDQFITNSNSDNSFCSSKLSGWTYTNGTFVKKWDYSNKELQLNSFVLKNGNTWLCMKDNSNMKDVDFVELSID